MGSWSQGSSPVSRSSVAGAAAASGACQTIWRVLVGPAQTEGERAAWLDQVKAEGFADAYFVRN